MSTDTSYPPVRLALFGVGLIGLRHIEIAAAEEQCSIVAAADPQESARDAVERSGAKFYLDYQQLLAEELLDGVIVATPNSTHAPVGIAIAQAGLPMLMEKPFTDTVAAGEALLAAAQSAGVAIAVGHHRRFDPSVQLAHKMLTQGVLGQLTAMHFLWSTRKHASYFDAQWRTQRPGGGPILINLIHDIDLMRHFGGEVTRIYAELGHDARGFEVEDVIAATVRFASGAIGSIVASDASPSPWSWELGSGENPLMPATGRNCYRLMGTQGSLALPRLELWRHADIEHGSWREAIAMVEHNVGPRHALSQQLKQFIRVVRGLEEPRVSGADGLATLVTTAAVTRSGESGAPVELSSDTKGNTTVSARTQRMLGSSVRNR